MASEVVHKMKEPEYKEGPEATKNFEEGMKALFNVPEDEVVKAEKKGGRARLLPASRVYANSVFPTRTGRGATSLRPCRRLVRRLDLSGGMGQQIPHFVRNDKPEWGGILLLPAGGQVCLPHPSVRPTRDCFRVSRSLKGSIS